MIIKINNKMGGDIAPPNVNIFLNIIVKRLAPQLFEINLIGFSVVTLGGLIPKIE